MDRTPTTDSESSPSSSFYTDFVPVKRKKVRKSKAPREKEPLLDIVYRLRDDLHREDQWLSECLQILREMIASSSTPEDILCLGLGSPSSSPNARAQLAFLLATCEHFAISPAHIFLYDPVFTPEDHALFGSLQFNVLHPPSQNKDAATTRITPTTSEDHALDRPTLCFMPHCDLELYESVIKANWTRGRLPRLLLVANRLMDYIDSNPRHKLEARAPFLLALAPTLECRPFPPSREWPTAFNSTAVQTISLSTLDVLETGELRLPEV
ncbi:hypothetical protein H0H92_011502 [Tricholoma furcatifolium]|nr:hypothetical protein H0H92_011502 [Tricholoma furcatifolium]